MLQHNRSKKTISLSLVIPLFNEAETIPKLVKTLNRLKEQLPARTEVLFVDDGSDDKTVELLKKAKLWCEKRVLIFTRNFGHQSALLAGLHEAQGDIVITMDGDLQHPPELIPKLLQQHSLGYDIVFTNRVDRHATFFKTVSSHLFYSLINLLSSTKIPVSSSDFRSMNRRSLQALLTLRENRKFLRGMVAWVGFETITINYEAKPRAAGESKYSLIKMSKLALTAVTSFSTLPIYLAAIFGVFLFMAAVAYAVYVLVARFVFDQAVAGWASVLFVLLVTGGFLSLFIALLGVYISAIYDEVKSRPNYIIKEQL